MSKSVKDRIIDVRERVNDSLAARVRPDTEFREREVYVYGDNIVYKTVREQISEEVRVLARDRVREVIWAQIFKEVWEKQIRKSFWYKVFDMIKNFLSY